MVTWPLTAKGLLEECNTLHLHTLIITRIKYATFVLLSKIFGRDWSKSIAWFFFTCRQRSNRDCVCCIENGRVFNKCFTIEIQTTRCISQNDFLWLLIQQNLSFIRVYTTVNSRAFRLTDTRCNFRAIQTMKQLDHNNCDKDSS